jgi:hypothetical protein
MGFNIIERPYFKKNGDWYIPYSIPWGGRLNPKLKPIEWFCWVLLNSENAPAEIWKSLVGSRTTIWRVKKILKEKGYL